jgi:Fe-S cluster assembly scaffold protein SufB
MQERHPGTRQFGAHQATVGRDAEIVLVAIGLGGSRAMSTMECDLDDRGAHVKVTGAYLLAGDGHTDCDITQEHVAPIPPPTSVSRACWPTRRGPCGTG